MRFGRVRLDEAAGATLAHAVATPSGTLRKGTVVDADVAARLRAAGQETVIVARPDAGDVGEDAAALRLAEALAGPGVRVEAPATGRSNLFATLAGLFEVNAAAVDAVNRIDPALTIATRPPLRAVEAGRMIATVKVIPFAVPGHLVEAAVTTAGATAPVLAVRPFLARRVAVVSTLLPSLKPSVVDKTLRVVADRLAPMGAAVTADLRVPHDPVLLAEAIARAAPSCDVVIVFGASAVVDAADVIPAAIGAAGGEVLHLGMPVDPGNLMVLGRVGRVPVLGAPGCARSPRENGFDFVLERVLAGRVPTPADIMGMGVGGLLMDIVSRPAPRSGEARREDPDAPRIAGIVLAAGRSTRFGAGNKLLAPDGGEALVRKAVRAAIDGGLTDVVVVTGHEAEAVRAALDGLAVTIVHNGDFATGQASSVKAGIAAVPEAAEAAMVLLGDMPAVDADVVRRIAAAYRPAAGSLVVVPVHDERRGNPVLWSRRYFPDLMALAGDRGARDLIDRDPAAVTTVEAGPGVLLDIDTPEALAARRGPAPD
jgi:molybdenum cofactor cytidylyltransferase